MLGMERNWGAEGGNRTAGGDDRTSEQRKDLVDYGNTTVTTTDARFCWVQEGLRVVQERHPTRLENREAAGFFCAACRECVGNMRSRRMRVTSDEGSVVKPAGSDDECLVGDLVDQTMLSGDAT